MRDAEPIPAHLWRTSTETVKRQGLLTAVGILTAGAIGIIWMAIKGTN